MIGHLERPTKRRVPIYGGSSTRGRTPKVSHPTARRIASRQAWDVLPGQRSSCHYSNPDCPWRGSGLRKRSPIVIIRVVEQHPPHLGVYPEASKAPA
jgi:hypothetical protein